MPDLTPREPEALGIDPLSLPRFRISGYYASDVMPPRVAGELAEQLPAYDALDRDEAVEVLVGRTDLQRIVVEERTGDDFNANITNSQWKVWRSWTRNDDGHGWTHS
jgi:hypothetical protein